MTSSFVFSLLKFLTFLLGLNLITCLVCGPDNPRVTDDCLPSSNSDYTCCLAAVGNYNQTSAKVVRNSTVCVLIPVSQTFITPYITSMDLGIQGFKLNISMDCGKYTTENQQAFPTCGYPNPQSYNDCAKYSSYNKTCCYVGSTNAGSGICLLNTGLLQSNTSVYGVDILCNSEKNVLNSLILLLTIMLIFFN